MDENEVREAVAMIETAKAQLEALRRQQEIIRLTVDEHSRARDTIDRIAAGDPGEDVLVPIGADSFIHAKISDNRNAVVGIGASVSFQRTPEEADEILDARIDELNRASRKIEDRAAQTEHSIQQLTEKIQHFYAQSGAVQDR
ncbi:MAG: prefoldin subunit alpha [Methanobacteriota archaeon]|nr:MAG: prefoldin subunit alpha [Euryarchaeota archaeon]